MNIEQAKNQVKYTVISYLSKDEFGEYIVHVERGRWASALYPIL